ncbi:hypothetical protein CDAR_108031 [Caerostris darwini]|uniref:Uncharacterized protein n=1 Tax=Caerostris darwini TaxID=1538125 RepID=A0AAV4X135_9ARAC|nr:hypothetical protein CDAR_108031 [Caerostris darwini]
MGRSAMVVKVAHHGVSLEIATTITSLTGADPSRKNSTSFERTRNCRRRSSKPTRGEKIKISTTSQTAEIYSCGRIGNKEMYAYAEKRKYLMQSGMDVSPLRGGRRKYLSARGFRVWIVRASPFAEPRGKYSCHKGCCLEMDTICVDIANEEANLAFLVSFET